MVICDARKDKKSCIFLRGNTGRSLTQYVSPVKRVYINLSYSLLLICNYKQVYLKTVNCALMIPYFRKLCYTERKYDIC